jgi:TRAP transporter 4TM/12TM fusion protein
VNIDHKAQQILRSEDSRTKHRALTGSVARVAAVIAVGMSTFHLFTAGFGVLTASVQRSIHLAFALTLIFLLVPRSARAERVRVPLSDWVLVAVSIVSCLYITMNWEALSEASRIASPNTIDIVLGITATLLVLEATRRTAGIALPLVAITFILYGFAGQYLPGILAHPGIPLDQFVGMNYLFTEGIFGAALGVSATFVVVFIIFGAFLEESGGGKFFIDLASAAFGSVRGGPAKIAVVGSGFFGMISGSAVANVASVGTFTIPLMRQVGYSGKFAAAVEAVASTGGLLMPPVMGAAAFIMAEMVGVSYLTICLAAAIPALLYYLSLYAFIDLEAAKNGLKGMPKENKPPVRPTLSRGGHLLIPPVVLIFLLAVLQWSAMKSGFYAVVATVFVAMLRKGTRLDRAKLINALWKGATGTLQIAAVCACAGIVVSIVSITGLGLTFSSVLIELAGGSLAMLLGLTMVASLVLGMGLPATPCYIILAVLAAPAISEFGVPLISAHLFVFYFGCLSAITPPVAVAAYAAAAIAGANPMQTGFTAWRLGLTAFIVPYMFVYGPALLMIGTPLEIVTAGASATAGVLLFAAGIQGFVLTRTNILERAGLLAAAPLLIKPGWTTDLIGLTLALVVGAVHFARYRLERNATLQAGATARSTAAH